MNQDDDLRRAARQNDLKAVQALLKAGASLNAPDSHRQTALHHWLGNRELYWTDTGLSQNPPDRRVGEALLVAGANPNVRDDNGRAPVVLAFKNGQEEAGRLLVERGADLRLTDVLGWSALTWHRFRNRYLGGGRYTALLRAKKVPLSLWDALLLEEEPLALLLAATTRPQHQGARGCTLLHLAAERGYLEVARRLLARGAQVSARNEEERTPLHYAIGGYWYVAQLGVRYWIKVGRQETRPELVRLLIQAGAKIEARDNFHQEEAKERGPEDGTTPLEWAIGFERPDLMRLLLDAGADPDQNSDLGFPLLFEALSTRNAGIVQALLDAGVDLDVKGYGDTPEAFLREEKSPLIPLLLATARATERLQQAAYEGKLDAVRAALAQGGSVRAADKFGFTALHNTVRWSQYPQGDMVWTKPEPSPALLKLLLEAGASLEARTRDGATPLIVAIRNGNLNSARFFLENGAQAAARDQWDWSALTWHLYRTHRRDALADALLRRGAKLGFWEAYLLNQEKGMRQHADRIRVDARDPWGTTPLMAAVRQGYLTLVQRLLERGADVRAQDNAGRTALHFAVAKGANGGPKNPHITKRIEKALHQLPRAAR